MSKVIKEKADKPEKRERYDLIPVDPLKQVAETFALGVEKHGERDWEKGTDWHKYFNALMRHAQKWWGGEELDKEDGQHHLAAVATNALILLEYVKTHPEYDDRSKVNNQ